MGAGRGNRTHRHYFSESPKLSSILRGLGSSSSLDYPQPILEKLHLFTGLSVKQLIGGQAQGILDLGKAPIPSSRTAAQDRAARPSPAAAAEHLKNTHMNKSDFACTDYSRPLINSDESQHFS
ncbi:hypothetical protein NDU88_000964 [Pleurodeles waltl]|uniref:Uncharacterized protein n=1 Tax=Pleurodeles waltl TaxID=8319 RepID=A0AAV7U749_PLEWA|nr:hypothetical protein NDU88_000964 [Pleurodeles waltl]